MERVLPIIDIPENLIFGSSEDIDSTVLNLYTKYPCRLKATVFILWLEGTIEAEVNLTTYVIHKNQFATLSSGCILQINKVEGPVRFYFMVFSSQFINAINHDKSIIELVYSIKNKPIVALAPKYASIYEDLFKIFFRMYDLKGATENPEVLKYILLALLSHLKEYYRQQPSPIESIPNRSEALCKEFNNLVLQHYAKERTIGFYANQLNITPTHLSNTVKKVMDKTVMDIISEVVVTDAKAQLKSTNLSINEISESLNFPNVSFFGKYFKRLVGMSPLQYRNS